IRRNEDSVVGPRKQSQLTVCPSGTLTPGTSPRHLSGEGGVTPPTGKEELTARRAIVRVIVLRVPAAVPEAGQASKPDQTDPAEVMALLARALVAAGVAARRADGSGPGRSARAAGQAGRAAGAGGGTAGTARTGLGSGHTRSPGAGAART